MKHCIKIRIFTILCMTLFVSSCEKDNIDGCIEPITENIVYKCIYSDETHYDAFCDLIAYKNVLYAAFRHAKDHVPHNETENGTIKLLSSIDGIDWKNCGDIEYENYDLRDPCFVVTNDGSLRLYCGLHQVDNPSPIKKNIYFDLNEFTPDGIIYSDGRLCDIGERSNYWVWKIYSYKNIYYGFAYDEPTEDTEENPYLCFVHSVDGLNFNVDYDFKIKGNETGLCFVDDNAYAVVRNSDSNENSFLLSSKYPYTDWKEYTLNYSVASPELLCVGSDIYVCGRTVFGMSLFKLDTEIFKLIPIYNYFAAGAVYDLGYPGMVLWGNYLYTVYYSCKDNNSMPDIFMNRFVFPEK